jgi:hypothetical protein
MTTHVLLSHTGFFAFAASFVQWYVLVLIVVDLSYDSVNFVYLVF